VGDQIAAWADRLVKITKPAFIVAELPAELAAWVRAVRESFEPGIAHLPAEITLAGSSGLGPISTGQSIESIRSALESALVGRLPFEARFNGVDNFPGTDIFFASPEPEPFVTLHRAIATSGIGFAPSNFPYRAHCSLKGMTPLQPGQRETLARLTVPTAPFTVRTVSVYEMDRMQPKLLLSFGTGGLA
jgi:hypothetical protein